MAQNYNRLPDDYSDEEDVVYLGTTPKDVTPSWDLFQSNPPPNETLAYEEKKLYQHTIKLLKIITYLVVFAVVLGSAVASKLTLLLMTSQLKHNITRPLAYNINKRNREVEISREERVQWTWAIFFCFLVPEILTVGRSIRICIFKRVNTYDLEDIDEDEDELVAQRKFKTKEQIEKDMKEKKREEKRMKWLGFVIAAVFEIIHVIGLGLFVFCVLPQVSAVKGAMLGNAVCLIPAIFALLSRNGRKGTSGSESSATNIRDRHDQLSYIISIIMDCLAIMSQIFGVCVWPFIVSSQSGWTLDKPWLVPVSTILTSLGWWENFVSVNSTIGVVRSLAKMRIRIGKNRYFYYLFIPLLKMLVFLAVMCSSAALMGNDPRDYFVDFKKAFNTTILRVTELGQTLADGMRVGGSVGPAVSSALHPQTILIENSYRAVQYALLVQILSAYVCYITGKFACKICIQEFSFSFPATLSVPLTIALLVSFCGTRAEDVCFAQSWMADYLFWNCPEWRFYSNFFVHEQGWAWVVLLLFQTWITLHIWFPDAKRLAHTEELFCHPMYNALLIDQDLGLNRKREPDDLRAIKKPAGKKDEQPDPHAIEFGKIREQDWERERAAVYPRIIACATMWHETFEEMICMFKSVFRMDAHQCTLRLARTEFLIDVPDYFEYETHIFFDDAFKLAKDQRFYEINDYVREMLPAIEKAASLVHEQNMKIRQPVVIPTPYGGRLEWLLPGKTRLTVHLKDKNKIRHRKRWSQCMYMYYLLGFELMDREDLSKEEKELRARNTFLLALDGDIDFQPAAVERLVELMKKDEKLGAACGRIHPVGTGPLVWYQKFEYAIGHWLQKATEHMIGCVLCSPGCFSLFRSEALMSPNVMKKYTTEPTEARHYVQYDQGEDRWLCTLMLQQGWRVEYSAASDAFTNSPTGFDEFFNQRRRWVPSTMANILDLLQDAKHTVKVNPNISTLYIWYQGVMMAGSILGPGTIFLMLVGAFVLAFRVDNYTSFYINVIPILLFIVVCYFCDAKIQLALAQLLSVIYALVMVAVLVALVLQISQDGFLAPSSIFLVAVGLSFIIAALVHPLEFDCLKHGVVYYITIPSMYLLLIIYSLFNLNNVSWGTRENPALVAEQKQQQIAAAAAVAPTAINNKSKLGFLQGVIPGLDKAQNNSEGSVELSCAGLFKLMFCVTEKPKDETVIMLSKIKEDLTKQNEKLDTIKRTLNPGDGRRNSISSLASMVSRSLKADMLAASGFHMPQNLSDIAEVGIEEDEEEEEDREEEPKRDDRINPYWADDTLLADAARDFLTRKEEDFWDRFIQKYLKPLDEDPIKKKKIEQELLTLRNKSVGAFFMMNAVFVTGMFLLQLNKDAIYFEWPIGGAHNFTYIEATDEIRVETKKLHLEPLGLLFVGFYAIILVVQFGGMILHRFSTFSQIMASTYLGLFKSSNDRNAVIKKSLKYIREAGKIRNANVAANQDGTEGGAISKRKTVVSNLLREGGNSAPPVMTMDAAFRKNFEKMSSTVQFNLTSGNDMLRRKSLVPGKDPILGALISRRDSIMTTRRSIAESSGRGSQFGGGRRRSILKVVDTDRESVTQV